MPPASPASTARGAYGLRLTGLGAGERLLVDVPHGWPNLDLHRVAGVATRSDDVFSADHAILVLGNGGEVAVDRDTSRAVFTVPAEIGDEELVHPYLAPVAVVVARWLERESLHAGSFVSGGGVWALIGERGSGKSSTLAALALRGHEVFGDDILVIGDRVAYASPRSLDLREDAASKLETGSSIGRAGARERWRMTLPPVVAEAPLRGYVFLEWADAVELIPVPPAERLRRVAAARALLIPPDARHLLALAAVPSWVLRRPRDWGSLDAAVELLVEL